MHYFKNRIYVSALRGFQWVNKWHPSQTQHTTLVRSLVRSQKHISEVLRKEDEKWCKSKRNAGFKDNHISSLECAGCSWVRTGVDQLLRSFWMNTWHTKQTRHPQEPSLATEEGKHSGASCSCPGQVARICVCQVDGVFRRTLMDRRSQIIYPANVTPSEDCPQN